MTLKLILAVTLIAVAPTVAFAQKDDPVDQAPKPTVEEAQKLVQTISRDKTKLQVLLRDRQSPETDGEWLRRRTIRRRSMLYLAKLDSLEQQVRGQNTRG